MGFWSASRLECGEAAHQSGQRRRPIWTSRVSRRHKLMMHVFSDSKTSAYKSLEPPRRILPLVGLQALHLHDDLHCHRLRHRYSRAFCAAVQEWQTLARAVSPTGILPLPSTAAPHQPCYQSFHHGCLCSLATTIGTRSLPRIRLSRGYFCSMAQTLASVSNRLACRFPSREAPETCLQHRGCCLVMISPQVSELPGL